MEGASARINASRALHETMVELTSHYHEQLHQLDAQIAQLQQQKAVVKALARAELNRSPELREAAGDQHHALVEGFFSAG
jgi:hypothetical protein